MFPPSQTSIGGPSKSCPQFPIPLQDNHHKSPTQATYPVRHGSLASDCTYRGRIVATQHDISRGITFLTKCIWANLPNIFTPTKLTSSNTAPSCLDFAQVAMPMAMVHPTTDKTISSYQRLMHDPTTADIWKTAFGKNFGIKPKVT